MLVVCSAGVDIEYRGDGSVLVEPSTTVQKAGQLILVQSKHRQAKMSQLLRPTVTFSRRCFQARAVSSGSLNAWHHGPDSLSMPAVNPEAVTLVNMRFCPYAQRTALCLNAKNIEYDVINSQLMTKPRWLWEINPIGKVPVLIHDGNTIYESLVTCEYIEVCHTEGTVQSDNKSQITCRKSFLAESCTQTLLGGERETECWWSSSTKSSCRR